MKKLLLSVLLTVFTWTVFAQQVPNAIEKAALELVKTNKEKSDKDIANEKAKSKAKTWMDRATAYEEVALRSPDLDSNAAWTAYEAYNQVIELDKDKNGGPGKLAQEAQKIIVNGGGNNLFYALLSQGGARYQRKDMAGAMKYMQKAAVINPKDTTAALYTGVVAQQSGNMVLARESFERFIDLGGRDPEIFLNLANLYQEEKNTDKAIGVINKGIALNPSFKNLTNQKFNLLYASGRMEDAIEELKRQIEKDPKDLQNVVNLGILYDKAADNYAEETKILMDQSRKGINAKRKQEELQTKDQAYTQEIARLNARVKKEPKNAEVKRQLGEVTKLQADTKAELVKINAETTQSGESVNAGSEQKIAELTTKRAEQSKLAQQYYTQALAIDPSNFDANYNMGVMYFNEAVKVKQKVDEMDMKAYQEKGKEVEQQAVVKFKLAMPFFEKAYEVKQEADVKENLRNLYNVLKQYEKTDVYDAKIQKLSE